MQTSCIEELKSYIEEYRISRSMPQQNWSQNYAVVFNNFIDFMTRKYPDTTIGSTTEGIIKEYLSSDTEARNATISNRFNILYYFFDYLYKKGIVSDIFKHLEKDQFTKTQSEYLSKSCITAEEFNKLEAAIENGENAKARLLLSLIIQQGLSKGEIANLKAEDIDTSDHVLYTRKTEHGEMQEKYLVPSTANVIQEYIEKEDVPSYKPLLGYKSSIDAKINKDLNKICDPILKRKTTPTALREYYRKKLLVENINSVNIVSAFFGESVGTTYSAIDDNDLYEDYPIDDYIASMFDK